MSEWSAIDFGEKISAALLETYDKVVFFDSIISVAQARELHKWLGSVLPKDKSDLGDGDG